MFSWFNHIQRFATPWTVAHQAPLSMGILQVRILEWVAIPFSRGSSWPGDWTGVSCIACTAVWFFTTEPPGKPNEVLRICKGLGMLIPHIMAYAKNIWLETLALLLSNPVILGKLFPPF